MVLSKRLRLLSRDSGSESVGAPRTVQTTRSPSVLRDESSTSRQTSGFADPCDFDQWRRNRETRRQSHAWDVYGWLCARTTVEQHSTAQQCSHSCPSSLDYHVKHSTPDRVTTIRIGSWGNHSELGQMLRADDRDFPSWCTRCGSFTRHEDPRDNRRVRDRIGGTSTSANKMFRSPRQLREGPCIALSIAPPLGWTCLSLRSRPQLGRSRHRVYLKHYEQEIAGASPPDASPPMGGTRAGGGQRDRRGTPPRAPY